MPLAALLAVVPLLPEATAFQLLALSTFATLAWTAFRHGRENGLLDWALTIGPAIYVGGLLAYFLFLRQLPDGVYWVRTVFLCTWAADTAAYLVGRRWGRTKIAPTLSPNKSLEGAIAGFVAAVEYMESIGWEAMLGHERALGDRFLAGMPESVELYGLRTMDGRVPTFCFNVDGHSPEAVARHLAKRDIAVWHGDYYAVETMKHLGLTDGAVRAGIVHYNTEDEVDRLLEGLSDLA